MNHFIFTILHGFTHRSNFFDGLVVVIARAGIWITIAAAAIFFIVLFSTHKNWKGRGLKVFLREIGVIIITVLSSLVVALILKAVFHESRPFIANPELKPLFTYGGHDSFPSGHAALLYAFAMAVALYHERTGWFFFLFALLVSWCRVISGIHYPIDIMGGASLGILIAYFTHWLLTKRMRKISR
ncbi:MAG: phosphoesterase PA-phosphatase related [Patescibacteria group bacterium]|nr:phosphoesterase PA-phosphatase related [Patescibacteria group bacterium]